MNIGSRYKLLFCQSTHAGKIYRQIQRCLGALRFSAVAVFDSLEQLAVLRWYEKNMVAGVKDLGILGETVRRSSPETWLALSALDYFACADSGERMGTCPLAFFQSLYPNLKPISH